MQKRKGISLIVLVITIIVMVILAGAIILTLNNSGIIGKASEAVNKTDEATLREMAELAWSEAYIDVKEGTSSDIVQATIDKIKLQGFEIQEGTAEVVTDDEGNKIATPIINGYKLTITKDGVTVEKVTTDEEEEPDYSGLTDEEYLLAKYGLKTGDQVIYDEGTGYTTTVDSNFAMTDMNWYVLGLNENRQVELIADKATEDTLYLAGTEGYTNGPIMLNTLCDELYGNGKGADSARSLDEDDLAKILGRTLVKDKIKYQFRYSSSASSFQYRMSSDFGVTYSTWTNTTIGDNETYITSGEGKTINTSSPETEILEIIDKGTSFDRDTFKNINTGNGTRTWYDILISPNVQSFSDIEPTYYWLATQYSYLDVSSELTNTYYYLMCNYIHGSEFGRWDDGAPLAYQLGGLSEHSGLFVKPVVTLKSDVTIAPNAEGIAVVQ